MKYDTFYTSKKTMPNFCVGFHNTYSAYCQSYKKTKMPKPTTKRSEITVYVSAYDASRYVRNRWFGQFRWLLCVLLRFLLTQFKFMENQPT